MKVAAAIAALLLSGSVAAAYPASLAVYDWAPETWVTGRQLVAWTDAGGVTEEGWRVEVVHLPWREEVQVRWWCGPRALRSLRLTLAIPEGWPVESVQARPSLEWDWRELPAPPAGAPWVVEFGELPAWRWAEVRVRFAR